MHQFQVITLGLWVDTDLCLAVREGYSYLVVEALLCSQTRYSRALLTVKNKSALQSNPTNTLDLKLLFSLPVAKKNYSQYYFSSAPFYQGTQSTSIMSPYQVWNIEWDEMARTILFLITWSHHEFNYPLDMWSFIVKNQVRFLSHVIKRIFFLLSRTSNPFSFRFWIGGVFDETHSSFPSLMRVVELTTQDLDSQKKGQTIAATAS